MEPRLPRRGTATPKPRRLKFDAWVGLDLGTFTTHVTASTGAFSIGATGAPVTVHQNPEASDPSTATEIQPDTLVAGHIAFSGEQAFYKVKLDGLPRGTKISAFLNVPSGADLDLTMSAPAAPSFFSTPVGSTPVGSTPIEDTARGVLSERPGLPPDTLQDVPVGSTPVGSTPVGSTPVGSTSANRGGWCQRGRRDHHDRPGRLRDDRRQRLQRRVEQPALRAACAGDAAAAATGELSGADVRRTAPRRASPPGRCRARSRPPRRRSSSSTSSG